jgi:hypothetical protein
LWQRILDNENQEQNAEQLMDLKEQERRHQENAAALSNNNSRPPLASWRILKPQGLWLIWGRYPKHGNLSQRLAVFSPGLPGSTAQVIVG